MKTVQLSDEEFALTVHALGVALARARRSRDRLLGDPGSDPDEFTSLLAWAEFSISQHHGALAALVNTRRQPVASPHHECSERHCPDWDTPPVV